MFFKVFDKDGKDITNEDIRYKFKQIMYHNDFAVTERGKMKNDDRKI